MAEHISARSGRQVGVARAEPGPARGDVWGRCPRGDRGL